MTDRFTWEDDQILWLGESPSERGGWNDASHPRGPDGKFAEKSGLSAEKQAALEKSLAAYKNMLDDPFVKNNPESKKLVNENIAQIQAALGQPIEVPKPKPRLKPKAKAPAPVRPEPSVASPPPRDPPSNQEGDWARQLSAGIESGNVNSDIELSGGGVAESVRLVEFDNGTRAVAKRTKTSDEALNEHLASQVGKAIGARVPDTKYSDDDVKLVWMQHVEHPTQAERVLTGRDTSVDLASRDARLLGLLDNLMQNIDRHTGNYMVGPDGEITGIDHSTADFTGSEDRKDASGRILPQSIVEQNSQFAGSWMEQGDRDQPKWKDIDPSEFSTEELQEMRRRLRETRWEFGRHNNLSGFRTVLRRFDAITNNRGKE